MHDVFLGGTCNDSTWRERLIKILNPDITYFNPVVKDWTEECIKIENTEKRIDRFCLFTITPKMTGVYSIAEAVQSSFKFPRKTIFLILREDDGKRFDDGQWKSLKATSELIRNNGASVCQTIDEVATILNVYARAKY